MTETDSLLFTLMVFPLSGKDWLSREAVSSGMGVAEGAELSCAGAKLWPQAERIQAAVRIIGKITFFFIIISLLQMFPSGCCYDRYAWEKRIYGEKAYSFSGSG